MENKYCNDCKYFHRDSVNDDLRSTSRKNKFEFSSYYTDTSELCGMGNCKSPEKIATSCSASMLMPCYYTFYYAPACQFFEEGIHKVYGITTQEISELPNYAYALRLWLRYVNSFSNKSILNAFYIPETLSHVQVNNQSNTEKNNSSC